MKRLLALITVSLVLTACGGNTSPEPSVSEEPLPSMAVPEESFPPPRIPADYTERGWVIGELTTDKEIRNAPGSEGKVMYTWSAGTPLFIFDEKFSEGPGKRHWFMVLNENRQFGWTDLGRAPIDEKGAYFLDETTTLLGDCGFPPEMISQLVTESPIFWLDCFGKLTLPITAYIPRLADNQAMLEQLRCDSKPAESPQSSNAPNASEPVNESAEPSTTPNDTSNLANSCAGSPKWLIGATSGYFLANEPEDIWNGIGYRVRLNPAYGTCDILKESSDCPFDANVGKMVYFVAEFQSDLNKNCDVGLDDMADQLEIQVEDFTLEKMNSVFCDLELVITEIGGYLNRDGAPVETEGAP